MAFVWMMRDGLLFLKESLHWYSEGIEAWTIKQVGLDEREVEDLRFFNLVMNLFRQCLD